MRFDILAITGAIFIAITPSPQVVAQIPLIYPFPTSGESDNKIISDWIYLDGRRLFQIAASRNSFSERLQNVQQNLQDISRNYLQSAAKDIAVEVRIVKGSPVIYVNDLYLVTITPEDAKQGNQLILANHLADILQNQLREAKKERQSRFLYDQAKLAAACLLLMAIASYGLKLYQIRWNKVKEDIKLAKSPETQQIATQLNHQRQRNLQEVRQRLFQLIQTSIWFSGSFFILGLFPQTRLFQVLVLAAVQIPLRLGLAALGTYVVIRLTYALIDHSTSTLVSGGMLLTPESSHRLQLRISTFSGVTKSISTVLAIVAGILIALISLNINIVPLLAGAGLVGVALSLASQNLIKDAINGFLIIIEDQYALGDVITVDKVGGLVENLNLRMTQVRDAEGRLITIPNSEIKIVANLSCRWSRADLSFVVSYDTDVDKAIKVMETVALDMHQESVWQQQIIEQPQVLGIDSFGEYGLVIRVWIKTKPLKQWDVAREYRRRLQIALNASGISIPVPLLK